MQVIPVFYAFCLLLVVTAIYAVLASQLFCDQNPEQFGRFSLALLTVRCGPFFSANAFAILASINGVGRTLSHTPVLAFGAADSAGPAPNRCFR